MIALLAFLLSLTVASALGGDYPAPMDDDLSDRLRMSWWDYHRSQIHDHNLDANGRTLKAGVDVHFAACAGDDGKLDCICPIGDDT